MDEREQFPLTIDFVSTAQGVAIQSFVVAEIAEHRRAGIVVAATRIKTIHIQSIHQMMHRKHGDPATSYASGTTGNSRGRTSTNVYRAIARSLALVAARQHDQGAVFLLLLQAALE